MKFTQFIILCFKQLILLNIDKLQYIKENKKEKAISADVYDILEDRYAFGQ